VNIIHVSTGDGNTIYPLIYFITFKTTVRSVKVQSFKRIPKNNEKATKIQKRQ